MFSDPRLRRRLWLIALALLAVFFAANMYVVEGTPDGSSQLSEMAENSGFAAENREYAIFIIAVALAGFIGYLTMTRR